MIEEPNSTTLVHPGDVVTVSEFGARITIAIHSGRKRDDRTPIRSPSKSSATRLSPTRTRWPHVLSKSAYNMMIYEVRDYCCGLLDVQKAG